MHLTHLQELKLVRDDVRNVEVVWHELGMEMEKNKRDTRGVTDLVTSGN